MQYTPHQSHLLEFKGEPCNRNRLRRVASGLAEFKILRNGGKDRRGGRNGRIREEHRNVRNVELEMQDGVRLPGVGRLKKGLVVISGQH